MARDNVDKPNPGIKVSSNVDKAYQQTTAGAGVQKSEAHYQRIVSDAFNKSGDQQSKK